MWGRLSAPSFAAKAASEGKALLWIGRYAKVKDGPHVQRRRPPVQREEGVHHEATKDTKKRGRAFAVRPNRKVIDGPHVQRRTPLDGGKVYRRDAEAQRG
jgi:hypothetical protein